MKELFATQGVHGHRFMVRWEGQKGETGAFNFFSIQDIEPGKQGYEIGGWTPVRDTDVIAKKTMTVNCSLGLQTCREETTLTLRLADEPNATASPPR